MPTTLRHPFPSQFQKAVALLLSWHLTLVSTGSLLLSNKFRMSFALPSLTLLDLLAQFKPEPLFLPPAEPCPGWAPAAPMDLSCRSSATITKRDKYISPPRKLFVKLREDATTGAVDSHRDAAVLSLFRRTHVSRISQGSQTELPFILFLIILKKRKRKETIALDGSHPHHLKESPVGDFT